MKKRFSEEQIIGFLQQAEAGIPVKELCRQHGFSDGSFYNWRAKFGGMSVPDPALTNELIKSFVNRTENGDLPNICRQ